MPSSKLVPVVLSDEERRAGAVVAEADDGAGFGHAGADRAGVCRGRLEH